MADEHWRPALVGKRSQLVLGIAWLVASADPSQPGILTRLTFGAQRSKHVVSTPFETIAKKHRDKEARRPRANSSLQQGRELTFSRNFKCDSVLNSREDDKLRITETSENLTTSLPGPFVKLSN